MSDAFCSRWCFRPPPPGEGGGAAGLEGGAPLHTILRSLNVPPKSARTPQIVDFPGLPALWEVSAAEGLDRLHTTCAIRQTGSMSDVVDLAAKFDLFSEHWSPKVVARLNDYEIKVVRITGDFVWHTHEDTDELFIVIDGRLTIQLRDRDVVLDPGQLFVLSLIHI